MRSRRKILLETPRVMAVLVARLLCKTVARAGRRNLLLMGTAASSLLLLYLAAALWFSTAPQRAAAGFDAGDFNGSAALYEGIGSAAARYNAANAYYGAGSYERAYGLYGAVDVADPVFGAAVWFNRGNTLVRLKEFAKAREAYARSLALHFDEAALENMLNVLDAESQEHMLTGRQKGKKRVQEQEEATTGEHRDGQRKTGGGNDRQDAAERNRGAGGQGKKVEREAQLEFSKKGSNRLSSRQYELINQRSVNETKPW